MDFKGHHDIYIAPQGVNKVTITTMNGKKVFVCDEYNYTDGKLTKHVDYINWKISQHTYNDPGERIELRTWGFSKNPNDAKLEGYKKFEYDSGVLTKEFFYEVRSNKENLIYEGIKIYKDGELIQEDFNYPDEVYTIRYEFDKKLNVKTIVYPEENQNIEYHFDDNGFLIGYLNFKRDNYCKVLEYHYKDNRLYRMLDYNNMKYTRKDSSKKIQLLGKPMFVNETEFVYDASGKIIKEIRSDLDTKRVIDELTYNYEG